MTRGYGMKREQRKKGTKMNGEVKKIGKVERGNVDMDRIGQSTIK